MIQSDNMIVAVIGLGYVGLPLAVEFARKFQTIGFDLSTEKIDAYCRYVDATGEIGSEGLKDAIITGGLRPTHDPRLIADADFVVVAVPTPVDEAHIPDFGPLIEASKIVGRYLKQGAIVIYESTVYPGATEEICIPVLEQYSGMQWKTGFHVGYSPERINPGDKEHRLTNIMKVVSGDTPETLEAVANLYSHIITAGVYATESIRVAEAAKVIENTQRDLNIALMNEIAIIFDRMQINTAEVLKAASTKWNFLKFSPGLVGGHCIGVDPYYLTHKAEMLGYHPQVILAGRRINDGMGKFVAEKTVKLMIGAGSPIKDSTVNLLGLTFKENCPDLRNSKVPDIVYELESYGIKVHVYDPIANTSEAEKEYGLTLLDWDQLEIADAIIVAVPHSEIVTCTTENLLKKVKAGGCVIDVKSCLDKAAIVQAGHAIWCL